MCCRLQHPLNRIGPQRENYRTMITAASTSSGARIKNRTAVASSARIEVRLASRLFFSYLVLSIRPMTAPRNTETDHNISHFKQETFRLQYSSNSLPGKDLQPTRTWSSSRQT